MGDIIDSDDKEKWIYSMQIKYLDQQLERLQLRCDELEQPNKDLASGCVAMTTDKATSPGTLKIGEAQMELVELAELAERRSAASDRQTEALKLQHSRRETELRDRINEQNSDNTKLAAALPEQLTEQQCDAEAVKEKLVCQREELELTWFTLKRDAALAWQKKLQEWRPTKEEQMEEIQNVVRKERAQHPELRQKVRVLVEEDGALLKEVIQLQQSPVESQAEDPQRQAEALRGRSLACRKELEEMRKTSHRLKVQLQDGGTTNERLQVEEDGLRHLVTSDTEEERQRTSEAEDLRADLRRGRSIWRSLEAVLQEAAVLLSHTLENSARTSSYREEMLSLREILQSAAPQGPGPTLEEFHRGQRSQTRTQTPDPLFLMARYRPGDLGLVPRPSWKQNPALSGAPPPPSRSVRNGSSYRRHVSSQSSPAVRPSGSSEGPDQK
uniref:LOW QUALITY PROTEIN: cilia- and flagella-associated protein 157-like n=1 Tax=Gasterosteus aculeatus aculeatus TaxID=481459 RepID=UPI001A9A20AD|nr:LOW QUALITY PROTEIN: cilia- and flagella-associated protein 157-like [Gasterosteus aculeatus aculeatus]